VLDPKLRAGFLQEGVDRHSTRASLLLAELERRDAVRVNSADSDRDRQTVRPRRSWAASRTKPGGPACAGSRLDHDPAVTEHVVFIVLEDDRLAFLQSRKSRGLE